MGGSPESYDWSRWYGHGWPGGTFRVEFKTLEDLLGDFFKTFFGDFDLGERFQTRTATREAEATVTITLEEAFTGTTRILEIDGRRVEVKIPPGVKDGSRIRLAGLGGYVYGRGYQDVYLKVNIQPHPIFRREDDDLYCEIPVDLYTAVLGGEVEVPTLSGKVLLKIPPETQAGQVFRLRGQGMPNVNNPSVKGDLFVKVKVQLPKNLTPKERELFRELAKLRAGRR